MALQCPLCNSKLRLLEISKEFECSSCHKQLRGSGWKSIVFFEIAAFAVLGGIAAALFARSYILLSIVVLVCWAAIDIFVRKRLLKITAAPESASA
jgi:hypothetical protein